MRCHHGCPVHTRAAQRRYRRFIDAVRDQAHIAWAASLMPGARREVRGNIYGRVLPIDRQGETTVCVTCGHPHWDTIRLLYVRCAMCECENVGRNNWRLDGDES